MRREYINYMPGLPINISLENIIQYPIHWHNSIEIIFVLKGTINVTIETQTYEVDERELEIINSDEAHAISSRDKDNRVLIFHIDPNHFEGYYDDIKNVFFYTNSSQTGAQEEEKYYILRRYLSILLCEAVQKQDGYDDMVEKYLIELLFHLINNFHQLIYEEESLKEDEVQFERYDRIVRYIYNNYMNKISLQDIAKREYLSSNYLSNSIKNAMGYSFNDFLNLTRVEESIKLLLDTDKTISEISEEMGFSHVRYFNKHFKRHHKCTPMQYRKKYKVDEERLEELKKYTVYDVKEGLEYLSTYLEDYERYNYQNRIVKVDIDASIEGRDIDKKWITILDLGKARELLYEKNKDLIEDIQHNIEFDYCIIRDIFSSDMNVFIDEYIEFIDWTRVKYVLEFLHYVNLKPIISLYEFTSGTQMLACFIRSFILYFCEIYGENEVEDWKFILPNNLDSKLKEEILNILKEYLGEDKDLLCEIDDVKALNPTYDTCYMIPYIINKSLNQGNGTLVIKAFDSLNREANLKNELFFGGSGIINIKGTKKPSYYAYFFLSKLGDKVIAKGDGYIVTTRDDDVQILLYSYRDDMDNIITIENIAKGRGIKNTTERKFSLNLFNLQYDYRIASYEINEKIGSAYNYWTSMGKPERLTDDEIKLLNTASIPKIKFAYGKKSTVYNILSRVEGYGAVFIDMKSVQKHL